MGIFDGYLLVSDNVLPLIGPKSPVNLSLFDNIFSNLSIPFSP